MKTLDKLLTYIDVLEKYHLEKYPNDKADIVDIFNGFRFLIIKRMKENVENENNN